MSSEEALLGVVGAVAIGRNEGERLARCLRSMPAGLARIVYVDSGSTDGSVELAQSLGALVVALDLSVPFTAARARNAGIAALVDACRDVELVQVLDGDCELVPGFIEAALEEMRRDASTGVVCGRRRERERNATIYNQLCDIEWDTPVGEATACGGDALIRRRAFEQAGGYDPALIAGEEPEMCLRLRRCGWKVRRIARDMTLHDAAIVRFGQWWRRAARSGHAYANVFARHFRSPDRIWGREVASALVWGAAVPLFAIGLAPFTAGASSLLFAGYLLIAHRARGACLGRGIGRREATFYGAFCVLSKFAAVAGMAEYLRNRLRGRQSTLIEYKERPKEEPSLQASAFARPENR
jgi:GT2 family glycosyltransferase